MKWIGIIVISPIWGMLSTQLFIQAWLSIVNLLVNFIGLVKGAVPRKDTAIAMGVALFSIALFSLLLRGGFWLLTVALPFGQTDGEIIVYWVFAIFSALYILPQIPSKVRLSWRNATILGEMQMNILKRKLGQNE